MDLPLVSVSLPSVPPSHWLPSFFRDAELALPLFSCLFYWPCHRRYARRSGEGTHDGGREGGREGEGTRQHTRCLRISGPAAAAAAVAIADQLICCRRRWNPGLGNDVNLMLLPSLSSDLLLLLADE
jgi:hypothetical protein